MKTAYTFYSFKFSDKEIDMIANLVKTWVQGQTCPVKRAGLTSNVIRYAICYGLLEEKGKGKRLHFTPGYMFDTITCLPVECLWRLVSPMLRSDSVTGYTVVNSPLWENLNIYPQNSRYASDRDMEAKINTFLKLSGHHYVHFQMAGSVWSIYQEEREAA